ncbi:MAG: DUF2510 domain-containing protein [Rhodoglobus sp.]
MSTPKSPGWYASPDGTPGEQWWNGASWSEARRVPGSAGSSTVTATPLSGGIPSYGTPVAPPPGVASSPPPGWSGTAPDPARPDPYSGARAGGVTSYVSSAKVNQPASLAIILGMVSLFFGIIGIGAIIAGVMGLTKAKTLPAGTANGRSSSLMGIVLGGIGILIGVVPFIIGIISAISISVS